MERYSRSWVVAAASGADFTYNIVSDDVRGVDMTVESDFHTLDLQLKSTSHAVIDGGDLIHDLDVRTYDLLRDPQRSGYAVLVLVVVDDDRKKWIDLDHEQTRLVKAAYYFEMQSQPATTNSSTVRLRVPRSNLLTIDAMKRLMAKSAARWTR